MKNLHINLSALALTLAFAGLSIDSVHADSTTYTFITPNTSLLKSGNWNGTSGIPVAGTVGAISQAGSAGPVGWNNNTNPGSTTFGAISLVSGATNLVIGDYTTKSSNINVNITLSPATVNNTANTVMANTSGSTVLFENDIAPSGDDLSEAGLTTYTLNSGTNVIQSSASSSIIIDNVVAGTGANVTYLGGGTTADTGATLELGAGSANDVAGGVAPNAPVKANAGSFSGSGTVQTADKNSFTGGLTIGTSTGGQAGTVQVDGANALPTTGNVIVNANSQFVLNGSATYGSSTQTVTLGATGLANGGLSTGTTDTSTLLDAVTVNSAGVNVKGMSNLTLSGVASGGGQLQSIGTGTLKLSGANTYQGGTVVSAGSLVAANATALGTGAVTVSGGKLSSSVATPVAVGGALTLSSGSIALNSSAVPTLALSSSNFSMTGGTLSLTYNLGTAGSIASAGGSFSITGGSLDLNNSFSGAAYNLAYDVLAGFTPGAVSNLSITNYDTTDYTANLSNLGVLTFTSNSSSVPEPTGWSLFFGGITLLAAGRFGRRHLLG